MSQPMTTEPSRRQFLRAGIPACVVGLAGCSGGPDTGSNSGGGGGSTAVVFDVSNQRGQGEAVVVAAAGAPEPFYVDVRAAGTRRGTSDSFPADTTQTELPVVLDPPLTGDGTLQVGLRDASTDERIGLVTAIEYTVTA